MCSVLIFVKLYNFDTVWGLQPKGKHEDTE